MVERGTCKRAQRLEAGIVMEENVPLPRKPQASIQQAFSKESSRRRPPPPLPPPKRQKASVVGAAPSPGAAEPAGWECKVDGTWLAYSADLAKQIDEVYRRRVNSKPVVGPRSDGRWDSLPDVDDVLAADATVEFVRWAHTYRIDFGRRTQVNVATRQARPVRRCARNTAQSALAPADAVEWEAQGPQENCKLVAVQSGSGEWGRIESQLQASQGRVCH
jgi:hypothetical protein